ncbi:PDZ and LIM domain protein Zasp isoform X1 [Manduca sexta]|uniref:PDZ and LIM domain protein Zasp isoform X1 n=1 Tax=Manduca sexta TaxID=7130 RepID=UPI00188EA641|nr:PDZ and LIM domain protein Zasp isoform X1 [Manduca sexta]
MSPNSNYDEPSRTVLSTSTIENIPLTPYNTQQSIKEIATQEYASASFSSTAMSSIKTESMEQHMSQTEQQNTSRITKSVAQESSVSQSFVYQSQGSFKEVLGRHGDQNSTTSNMKYTEGELENISNTSFENKMEANGDKIDTTKMKDNDLEPKKIDELLISSDSVNTPEIIEHNSIEQFESSESNFKQQTDNIDNGSAKKPLQTENNNEDQKTDTFEKNTLNSNVSESFTQTYSGGSMLDALTIAPERPYSPLPSPPQPVNSLLSQTPVEESKQCHEDQIVTEDEISNDLYDDSEGIEQSVIKTDIHIPDPSPIFTQQLKREITPIPPLKVYNPPKTTEAPVPMPVETKPYIPPDFTIIAEPKTSLSVLRSSSCSPMIDALTTAPDRPFTPKITPVSATAIERGSLREALTIAPDRPFSPLPINITNPPNHYTATTTVQTHSIASEILKPIATQSTNQIANQDNTQILGNIQNTYELQSSSQASAFKPVSKQACVPQNPQEHRLVNIPPMQMKTKPSSMSEFTSMQQSSFASNYLRNQGFSSVKATQHYFEELDKKESLSSTAIRSKSGLHKPDSIPPYQKNIEMLPSQRGISPDMYREKPIPQRPVTPNTDPPTKRHEKSQERQMIAATPRRDMPICNPPTIITPIEQTPIPQSYLPVHKENPITMTFQPVSEGNFMRVSPIRSRPSTPSLINKPAPIIPHYQMNLVPVEHLAPETHLYEPTSREGSRSPTPKPRSRSPAPGPPPNPLKAHAPRIKETTSQGYMQQAHLPQPTSNIQKGHEILPMPSDTENYSAYSTRQAAQAQQPMVNQQRFENMEYQTENYTKDDINVKEDSLTSQHYDQRQLQSQNVAEYGNTTVQTTRKTFEEFGRTQSAKVVEIRHGGSSSFGGYQLTQPSIEPSNVSANQNYPTSFSNLSTPQTISSFSSSINPTNENIATASSKIKQYQPTPSSSGANQGPVCDPTPSTGSSVGAAARGKTFGVSSAPKRGRGILNKPALPGSRVPLCASCNGNIRGPFITALGRIWCPEHFICVNATCRRALQDIGFVEENGQLYCEFCFEQYIAPSCDKCHAKIKGDCLNAIGKHFHPECFSCVYCGKLFGNNPFFLEDGLPYCEADWNELFTTKCFACGFPVEAGDRWVEALNNNYHSQCFNCTVCKKNLEGQSFFAKGGRPFCKSHAR